MEVNKNEETVKKYFTMDRVDCWYCYCDIISLCNNKRAKMKELNYLNDIIQGLIIFLLIFNAYRTQTLSLFNIIITLLGVGFGFYVKIIDKIVED